MHHRFATYVAAESEAESVAVEFLFSLQVYFPFPILCRRLSAAAAAAAAAAATVTHAGVVVCHACIQPPSQSVKLKRIFLEGGKKRVIVKGEQLTHSF